MAKSGMFGTQYLDSIVRKGERVLSGLKFIVHFFYCSIDSDENETRQEQDRDQADASHRHIKTKPMPKSKKLERSNKQAQQNV